ncbi:MAG: insulinase family protein [Calditrichaceae bacterium]
MNGRLNLILTLVFSILFFTKIFAADVIELPIPTSNKVVVKLMFINGSISDPAGKEGLTFTTASLMANGAAGDMSYAEIQDKLYPWAAGYGASVDKEVSVFTFRVPSDFAEDFYPVLRDVMLNPTFNENDFQRIKINQQNYVDKTIRGSSDEVYSKKALEDLLFRGTNYQHMIQGKSASVQSITLEDFAALMIANSWLGEHRKSYSRLYQKIREARSMNYGDYSYIEWYEQGESYQLPPSGVPRHSNYFAIWIRPVQIGAQLRKQYEELSDVKIGHAHFALRMALREWDLMIENGMSKEDFEETRTFLQSYIKLYAQSPGEQLGWLLDSKFYGRKDYLKDLDALLAQATLEDVNNAIKKYWHKDNMFVTIVTDVSEAQPLAESLRENLPSPMSYSNLVKSGLPEEILKEDEQVANYKLNVTSVKIVKSEDTFK